MLEVLVDLRGNEVDLADDHLAGATVDRDHVSRRELPAAGADLLTPDVDGEPLAARDAGLPHPASDDGCMGGHAALRGQDPARLEEPVDVVRGRLPANEDDVLARLAAILGSVGVEDDLAGG